MQRCIVVTGASSGIGEEFVRQLKKENKHFVLVARREDRLKEIAKELDIDCTLIKADLSKEDECYRLMDCLKDMQIDLFINNAGFGDCHEFMSGDLNKEINMIDLNIKALHILTKLVLQHMNTYQLGALLNVASSAGLMAAGPYMSTYYATKAYVTSLTRGIAKELKDQHSPLYIGCLCPGPVKTEFNHVANVEFNLKSITSQKCVSYAIKKMKKGKITIVPTFTMKLATIFGRVIPTSLLIHIVSLQQKKKLS